MARTFKAKVFARDARRARINDDELCRVIAKAQAGQFAADLGGGVIKARLNKNEHRSIILMKGGDLGFTNTCLRRRTGRTSRPTNSRRSSCWPAVMGS